jgi:hypothetical protein
MIYLHEIHEVAGGKMEDFETAIREQWRPLAERDGNVRLLWFWDHGHGTGPSYQAVSISVIRDWPAWGALIDRLTGSPDGRTWYRDVAPLRKDVTAKLLLPVHWSPLQDVELVAGSSRTTASAPAAASGEAPPMYLHDTGWPFPGRLVRPQTRTSGMISIAACWRTVTGKQHEVVLLQKIENWEAFARLLTDGAAQPQRSGWMVEGLTYRDRWESKLLRTVSWSPTQ